MRPIIRRFDRFLRATNGVFEFSTAPDCILRLQRGQAQHTVVLGAETIPKGAPLVEVHYFNEHMPPLPAAGSDVAWAARFARLMVNGFRDVAATIDQRAELQDVAAVHLTTVLSPSFFERLGFTPQPVHNPLGRFGIFWDNLYTWGLMYTYNQVSLNRRTLLGLQRREFWATRRQFMARYLNRSDDVKH